MSEHRPRQLTRKQKMFVAEYLVDLNATQAAARAGYSKRSAYSTGHKTLKIPAVHAAIAAQQSARFARLAMSADEALAEVSLIARANVLDYIGRDGEPAPDLAGLDRDNAAPVADVTVETFTEGSGNSKREGRRLRVKLHDKLGAIDRLIKLYLLLLGAIWMFAFARFRWHAVWGALGVLVLIGAAVVYFMPLFMLKAALEDATESDRRYEQEVHQSEGHATKTFNSTAP